MPHNPESARATVLDAQKEAAKPLRNPVSHVYIIGGAIAGFVMLLLALVAALVGTYPTASP
jgi:hypothetical protein